MPTETTPATPNGKVGSLPVDRPSGPTFDDLFGAGEDLWADDAEFERFLQRVEATRAEEG